MLLFSFAASKIDTGEWRECASTIAACAAIVLASVHATHKPAGKQL